MKLDVLLSKTTEYALTVLAPKAKTWLARGAIGASVVPLTLKARGFIQMTGALGADDEVDIDTLHDTLVMGFKTAGKLEVLNGLLTFDVDDIEDLFAYLKR